MHVMFATLAALVLNLAVGPNGLLVPDQAPASGVSGATHHAPPPPPDAPPPPGVGRRCVVPADLPHDRGAEYQATPGNVPADLPGPHFELPRKIEMGLGQTVGSPAPNYSQLTFGNAEIDTKTGAVSINSVDFSARPMDCR